MCDLLAVLAPHSNAIEGELGVERGETSTRHKRHVCCARSVENDFHNIDPQPCFRHRDDVAVCTVAPKVVDVRGESGVHTGWHALKCHGVDDEAL